MKEMSAVKKICICAICIAMCYVLPIAFHPFGLGNVLAPMHIPVLLCGLICGGFYGICCGVAGPILSSVLSGMPPADVLVSMIPELVVYGLVTGLLMKRVRTGKLYGDLYISLLGAMILGRVAGGIVKALLIAAMASGETYGFALWATGYFVTGFPGIAVQLAALPTLVVILMKARVIPGRYTKIA